MNYALKANIQSKNKTAKNFWKYTADSKEYMIMFVENP